MQAQKPKIIVVGAGISGLAAANALIAEGFDVTVLEARDRCGGRIWVDHSLDVPLSRGAAWVHGMDGNPVSALIKQYPTNFFAVDPSKFCIFHTNGKPISNELLKNFNHEFELKLQRAKELALQSKQDISLAETLSSFIYSENQTSVEQSLLERRIKFFESYIGAEYEALSARCWDEEEALPGKHAVLADAYQAVIAGLASCCTIQLNAAVQAIHTGQQSVEVMTSQGIFVADAVLVTLPLGVLKKQHVIFQPALSAKKQDAIDRLGMGLFNVIAMQFPHIFWPEDAHVFFLANSSTASFFYNVGYFLKQPILLGYVGGKTARLLEAESDERIIEKTVQHFRNIFKQNIPFPEKYFITRWAQDPWSYGSYSYLPVGATREDRDLLAEPESGRIFFAGEATSKQFPATVHGAYLSGLREAERLKNFLV